MHTNGVENFWALLKRALKGTQVHIDPEHLHRYVAERVFTYNACHESDLSLDASARWRVSTVGG